MSAVEILPHRTDGAVAISSQDLARVVETHTARIRAAVEAKVAAATAALAEARFEAVHQEIILKYRLRDGDVYNDEGVITRAPG